MSAITASSPVKTRRRRPGRRRIDPARAALIREVCEEAIERFRCHGLRTLEWEGRPFQCFTDEEIEYGCKLMRAYFAGTRGPSVPGRVMSSVRFGFVMACKQRELTGLPVQTHPWYAGFERRVEAHLRQKASQAKRSEAVVR